MTTQGVLLRYRIAFALPKSIHRYLSYWEA
jgi:hypothetical protein